jgi:hypothetical protein
MLSVMHPALRATVGRTHELRAPISPRETLHQSRVASSRRNTEVQLPLYEMHLRPMQMRARQQKPKDASGLEPLLS